MALAIVNPIKARGLKPCILLLLQSDCVEMVVEPFSCFWGTHLFLMPYAFSSLTTQGLNPRLNPQDLLPPFKCLCLQSVCLHLNVGPLFLSSILGKIGQLFYVTILFNPISFSCAYKITTFFFLLHHPTNLRLLAFLQLLCHLQNAVNKSPGAKSTPAKSANKQTNAARFLERAFYKLDGHMLPIGITSKEWHARGAILMSL